MNTIRRLRVSTRVALATTLVLALAVLLGVGVFRSALRRSQLRELDRSIDQQVTGIKASFVNGRPPKMVKTDRDANLLCQIVGRDGKVMGYSANVSDMTLMVKQDSSVLKGGAITRTTTKIDGVDARITKVAVNSDNNAPWILVAAPLRGIREADANLVRQLRVSGPLLVMLSGLGVWFAARRALRPVDQLRSQVDRIGAQDLSARVSIPKAQDEVGRLSRTMNDLLSRVQESHDRQTRFVGDASHELRSPLATIRTRLEVALRSPERTDWPSVAEASLRQTTRMERLVDDLLVLARTDETREAALVPVDLDELITEEVSFIRTLTKISIDTTRVSAGRVLGQPDDLRRVVVNLVSNAVAFANATVQLSLQAQATSISFVVDDDGPGVPVDQRARIFDRFTQADASRARTGTGGAGLGLAIVADVVRRHHGQVSVQSAPLGGARFIVELPGAA